MYLILYYFRVIEYLYPEWVAVKKQQKIKCAGKDKSPNVNGRHQIVSKNEKELETIIHAVKIYSQDIGMEFGIKNAQC